jgi:hypothetical protein
MRSDPERSCGSTSLRPSAPELKQQTFARPPTPALRLGSPLPHLQRNLAHPCHICAGTGLTPPTSAPGLSTGNGGLIPVLTGYSRGTRGALEGYYGVLWGGTLRGPVPFPSPRGAGRSPLGVYECACDQTSPASPGADVGPQEEGVSPNPAPDVGRGEQSRRRRGRGAPSQSRRRCGQGG